VKGRRLWQRAVTVIAAVTFAAAASTAQAANPALNMLTMGDSYSAGVGLGMGYPPQLGCDRDHGAYGPLAASKYLSNTYTVSHTHVACSGAFVSDVLNTQISSVNVQRDVVAMTVGGNDIGFFDKAMGCLIGECGEDTMTVSAGTIEKPLPWTSLEDKLKLTYASIRNKMRADGHLFVLTYPIPFSRALDKDCEGFSPVEQNATNALVVRLNQTIEAAVKAAAKEKGNVHLVVWDQDAQPDQYTVPTRYTGGQVRTFQSAKTPNGLCNGTSRPEFIQGKTGEWLIPTPLVLLGASELFNSFHPLAYGYEVAAARLTNKVRAVLEQAGSNSSGGSSGSGSGSSGSGSGGTSGSDSQQSGPAGPMPAGWSAANPTAGWACGWADGCVSYSGFDKRSYWGQAYCDNGHNCTSYVAYRLFRTSATNFVQNCHTGSDAASWDERARKCGLPVDGTPTSGSIIQWDGGAPAHSGGTYSASGHVAYVDAVYGDTLLISESSCSLGAARRAVVSLKKLREQGLKAGGAIEVIHPGGSGSGSGSSVPQKHNPVGVLDGAQGRLGGVVEVNGWAFDPDAPTSPVDIHIYVGGPAGVGLGFNLGAASLSRPDVGNAHPHAGPDHGFSRTLTGVPGGKHKVYAYAYNVGAGDHALIGTHEVTVPTGDPFGYIDGATAARDGTAQLDGWAIDPDNPTHPVDIHVYVDGPAGAAKAGHNLGPATNPRADVAAAHPGAGDKHGFSKKISGLGPGKHTLYFYAINLGPGSNVLLGTREVYVPVELPFGTVDIIQGRYMNEARVAGWAIDPEATDGKYTADIHVYVDGPAGSGAGYNLAGATLSRPDVGAAYPGRGNNHGFDKVITGLSAGTHTLYIYAVGRAGSKLLLSRKITVGTSFSGTGGAATPTTKLKAGQSLKPGEALLSSDRQYALVMQGDGNLVLYHLNGVVWHTSTSHAGSRVSMQGDGNFVIYNKSGQAVWATMTNGKDGAEIQLQTDGNLVIYKSGSAVWWYSKGGFRLM
jgi:surface antigen/lysophospholipase L1-like esterase